MGVWRSGSASALHAEGLGFDPLVVHTFCSLSILELFFCSPWRAGFSVLLSMAESCRVIVNSERVQ
jgi:hypothetical protein